MIIENIQVGPLQTNCYLVADEETREGLIIDPGDEANLILDLLQKTGIKPRYIINTHEHFDHIGANKAIKEQTRSMVYCHQAASPFIISDKTLQDGDHISVGQLDFKIIHTPGHAPGSICLLVQDKLFSGDTLFADGVGRTDLPGGSTQQLRKSLSRLMELPDDTEVFPGHGPFTTIGKERGKYNLE